MCGGGGVGHSVSGKEEEEEVEEAASAIEDDDGDGTSTCCTTVHNKEYTGNRRRREESFPFGSASDEHQCAPPSLPLSVPPHGDAPQLQVLNLEDEVRVSGRVLLDHVLHVVRLQGVLEALPGAHHQHLRFFDTASHLFVVRYSKTTILAMISQ